MTAFRVDTNPTPDLGVALTINDVSKATSPPSDPIIVAQVTFTRPQAAQVLGRMHEVMDGLNAEIVRRYDAGLIVPAVAPDASAKAAEKAPALKAVEAPPKK